MKTVFEPEDIQNIVTAIIGGLKPYLSGKKDDTSDDTIFDVPGLCEYIHVTHKWIHERTHLKEIPHYKLSNKQLRFRKRDIDKWIDSLKIAAINPLLSKAGFLK